MTTIRAFIRGFAMRKPKEERFFKEFDRFLTERKLSDVRTKNFLVLYRLLQRFEKYMSTTRRSAFRLTFESITVDVLKDFESFIRNEHTFLTDGKARPRGQNTINSLLIKFRTFFKWAIAQGITANNPFNKFPIEESIYGTPYYISIEERNMLYRSDLSFTPSLAVQRDIFVFQCLVGCRVSDLYKLTYNNIINGAVEYIPRKTRAERPVTVRVPLNDTAMEILNRYHGHGNDKIFPFISQQKYNMAIKRIFAIAGLTRPVIVLDPITREERIRPLNEIASSHLARRTFIGNLYKKVKDPDLVSALSGHKAGSQAFARYRDIDEEMKRQLVDLLNE